jgi:hypothetical protein
VSTYSKVIEERGLETSYLFSVNTREAPMSAVDVRVDILNTLFPTTNISLPEIEADTNNIIHYKKVTADLTEQ